LAAVTFVLHITFSIVGSSQTEFGSSKQAAKMFKDKYNIIHAFYLRRYINRSNTQQDATIFALAKIYLLRTDNYSGITPFENKSIVVCCRRISTTPFLKRC